MGRLWKFLRQERNRQVLGWLGGGLVVLAAGLWTAFVYFFPLHKGAEPKPANVEANCGGVAIGGNVSGATITTSGPAGSDCATTPK